MSEVKMAWGVDAKGTMRHVSEVEKGKACNCFCANVDCGTPLIARKGECNAEHFSHESKTDCAGESALHKAAKQIIEDAANEGLVLSLPPIEGYVTEKDLLLNSIVIHDAITPSFALERATQEVRISQEIIADVLAVSDRSEQLAIEICVTNAKDEISASKYKSCLTDAVEIDLSHLPWNISRNELKTEVLEVAPRTWVFSLRKLEYEKVLYRRLSRKIEKLNNRYLQELGSASEGLRERGELSDIRWKTLKAEVTEKGAGSTAAKVTRTPKVKKFRSKWSHEPYGYSGIALLKNNVEVDVFLTLNGGQHLISFPEKPSLVLSCRYNIEDDYIEELFDVDWKGIEKWHQKLKLLAGLALREKVKHLAAKQVALDKFAFEFQAANLPEKMNKLCSVLSLDAPLRTSKLAEHWNTSWDVWKTLVWRYKVFDREGCTIYCRGVARDPWFQTLLGFSTDVYEQEQRERNLSYWFYSLQKLGFLERIDRDCYVVTGKDKSRFKPWQYLK